MGHEVVVFDPEGILPDGKVVAQDGNLAREKRRGVVSIPVVSRPSTALGPFAKFSYGDGLEVGESIPAHVGSAALWLPQGCAAVSWAAMLRHKPGSPRAGLLRLVGDARQPPLVQAPLSSNDPGNQGDVQRSPHRGDSWVVIVGGASCQASQVLAAFALHGWARGCRLAWLAVAQSL